jgi:hypothetical protein
VHGPNTLGFDARSCVSGGFVPSTALRFHGTCSRCSGTSTPSVAWVTASRVFVFYMEICDWAKHRAVSNSEALAEADTAITVADMEANGSFTLPASRKAAKQKAARSHPTAANPETVEDIDVNRSIHQRYLMCRDMPTDLDFKGILKAHAHLQSALQEMLRLTATTSPVRHSRT